MSKVHKCDICGEIYGDYPVGAEKFAEINIRSVISEFRNIFGENKFG